jgi:GDPmannose 4,6-dehydratase
MYLILQQDTPDDYVIATGITTEVREFVRMAFGEIGLELIFKGEGVDEKGYINTVNESLFTEQVGAEFLEKIKAIDTPIVEVDKAYFRPTEVELLIGDATKSRTKLNWIPEYDLAALVKDMMISDVKLMKKETYLKEGGFRVLNYFE